MADNPPKESVLADKPSKDSGDALMKSALVSQHKRMAAGEKITGETLPPMPALPKTPA